MFVSNHGAKVAEPLLKEAGGDQVLMEQYLDFLTNRSFRQSLLVHAAEKQNVQYRLDAQRMEKLHYALGRPARRRKAGPRRAAPSPTCGRAGRAGPALSRRRCPSPSCAPAMQPGSKGKVHCRLP
jgi:hypothetical protein